MSSTAAVSFDSPTIDALNVKQTNDAPLNGETFANSDTVDSLSLTVNGVKYPKLKGELLNCKGYTTDGVIILTNYRIFFSYNNPTFNPVSLPIGAVETAEIRDLLFLHIHTKLARSVVCSFVSSEECTKWMSKIADALVLQSKLEDLFCFKFYKASFVARNDDDLRSLLSSQAFHKNSECVDKSWTLFSQEFKRMEFDSNWRISEVNKDFKMCTSYPRYLIVPNNISDDHLEIVANFRYSRRIPTVVWRHRKNGYVIARSSQPEVGWLGWRDSHDENLLQSIVSSCVREEQSSSKKLLILDARSYAAAVANRAKGGGCECPEYYPCCEVQFMCLANIHSIRKSFNALRYICDASADQLNWLTLLDNSKWLNHISSLIKSALIVVNAINDEGRPVLVHCSDGWDRTPQIVALSELMLDPYYRTVEGFRVLIEREWCEFGHKFSERCGNASNSDDVNERCPVFLQWLDCVHQLVRQNPCSFEFNMQYLEKLALHTYSSLFSTFICNNMHERFIHQVNERSHSLWSYVNHSKHHFTNYLYSENEQVLKPSYKIKHMFFWSDVYGPLTSHSTAGAVSASNGGIYSSVANNNVCCDAKKDLNADLKNVDSDTNTNETESDLETVSSEKHSNLVKTLSCDNVNSLEDIVITSELNARNRHHSESDLLRSLCIINAYEESDTLIDEMHSKNVKKYYKDERSSRDNFDRDCVNQLRNEENRDDPVNTASLCSESNDQKNTEMCVQQSEQIPLSEQTLFAETNVSNTDFISDKSSRNSDINASIATELNGSHIINELKNTCSDTNCFSGQCIRKSSVTRQSTEQYCDDTDVHTSGNKHTRTPSSGCPATPNDDQCSDISGSKSAFDSLTKGNQIFDIDGQVIVVDEIQMRLQQLMLQHKAEVEALRKDLYMIRLTLCQQINYCGPLKNDKPNDEHSMSNDCQNQESNNSSLDTSWVNIPQYRQKADAVTDSGSRESGHVNGISDVLSRPIEVYNNSCEHTDSFQQFHSCRGANENHFCRCVNGEERLAI